MAAGEGEGRVSSAESGSASTIAPADPGIAERLDRIEQQLAELPAQLERVAQPVDQLPAAVSRPKGAKGWIAVVVFIAAILCGLFVRMGTQDIAESQKSSSQSAIESQKTDRDREQAGNARAAAASAKAAANSAQEAAYNASAAFWDNAATLDQQLADIDQGYSSWAENFGTVTLTVAAAVLGGLLSWLVTFGAERLANLP
jgi:hypothetical protein